MSKRKAPPGCYWRGPFLWGRIEVKGVETRFSLRTSNAAVAVRRLKERRDIEVAATRFGERRLTWKQAVTDWAGWIAGQVEPETAKRYAVSLRQVEPHLSAMFADEIGNAAVGELIKARQAQGTTNATIRRDLSAVSSVLGFCEANELREGNPALAWLGRIKERRDPIVLPDPAHVERVIARAPGMMADLIRAARATGCRLTEIAYARRSNFNRSLRTLTITGKGNKTRTIDLEPFGGFAVIDELPAFLSEPWLFWHDDGEPYRNLSSRFSFIIKSEHEAAIKEAGPGRTPDFRPFQFHHLRHLHAVEWLRSGRSIYVLQKRLGHRSITTTETHYLQFLTPEQARAVMLVPLTAMQREAI